MTSQACELAGRDRGETPVACPEGCAAGAALKTQCYACQLRALCSPCGSAHADWRLSGDLICDRKTMLSGETLHLQGDRFQFLHAVRSGSFKSCLALSDGRDQVCGFHSAGDVIGLDSVDSGRHETSVIALEDTQACAIAYAPLMKAAPGLLPLQHTLTQLMGREIMRGLGRMMLLGNMSARERIASFLLDMSRRSAARGASATEFNLSMTRAEIGSYLGMTLETVSRSLAAFMQECLIDVSNRRIRITNLDAFVREFEPIRH